MTKTIFQTKNGDWIISKNLYSLIKSKHLKVKMNQVVNFRCKTLDYYHLQSSKTLPKMDLNSSGLVTSNQCQSCLRDGHFNDVKVGNMTTGKKTIVEPLKFVYRNEDLEGNLISSTWECAGVSNKVESSSRVIRYARPWTIVAENFKTMLEEEGLNYIAFVPIKTK